MTTSWMLDWNEAAVAGPTIAGGKGWNLGRLHRYGFNVPSGGVVSSAAYSRFMSDPKLQRLQNELAAISADEALKPQNAARLEAMRQAIHNAQIPDDIASEIHDFLVGNQLHDVPIAVRSSATAEDSATASFAGIHESRLGQVGLDAVIESIKACYASLWTPRAIAYRRRLGLSDSDVLCAVVLCRMIGENDDPSKAPVAAGVAFSCDPKTGRIDVVTIGAVRGLGQSVVDGSANPEEITVNTEMRFEVTHRSETTDPVLTDEQAIHLAHLAQRVQWALGDGQDPQDIEWAFDGSTFWLVQARPVTKMPRYTFTGAENLPVYWSNANLKDALPGVLSPLAWSMTLVMVRRNLYASHEAAGYDIPPGLEAMRRFSGRAYFDITSLFWAYYDGLGLTAKEFNRNLGGHQPEIPAPEANPMKGPHALRRSRTRFKMLRAIMRTDKMLPGLIQACFDGVRKYRGVDLTHASEDELRQILDEQVESAYHFGPYSMIANASGGIWHDLLENALAKIVPDEAYAVAAQLVAGSGSVVSAEHGYRLFDLAEAARDDNAARDFLQTQPIDGSKWKDLPKDSPFRRELQRFLDDFGHRAVYEVDIANPRWIEDPTYILEQVKLILDAGLPGDFRETARQKSSDAERIVAQRTRMMRPMIRWITRRAQKGSALREGSKSALVAHLEPIRRVTLEIGRRMTNEGLLDDPADIFYLAWVEIDAYMRRWWDGRGAKNLVHDRKIQHEAWLSEEPPDVIFIDENGVPQEADLHAAPVDTDLKASLDLSASGARIKGTGVSAGIASGRVRILRHPDESDKLGPGEILVAPSTDPGWTPLFMRAAAIVMEVGGFHSHGAIVAREFGIPAVVNIPQVLSILKDGEIITVDGNTGTIVRDNQ